MVEGYLLNDPAPGSAHRSAARGSAQIYNSLVRHTTISHPYGVIFSTISVEYFYLRQR